MFTSFNIQWTSAGGNDNKIDGFKPRRKTQGLNDTGAVRQKLRKKIKYSK